MLFDYATLEISWPEFWFCCGLFVIGTFGFGVGISVFPILKENFLRLRVLSALLLLPLSASLYAGLFYFIFKDIEPNRIEYERLVTEIENSYGISETNFSKPYLKEYKYKKGEAITNPFTMSYIAGGETYFDLIVLNITETEDGRFVEILSGNDRLSEFTPQSVE